MDRVNGFVWTILGDRTTNEGTYNPTDGTSQAATNAAVTKESTTTNESFSAPTAGMIAIVYPKRRVRPRTHGSRGGAAGTDAVGCHVIHVTAKSLVNTMKITMKPDTQLYRWIQCVEEIQNLIKAQTQRGLVAMFRCGECIGCFQTEDCGKCDGCAGGQPCFKRKCVQESILMQRHSRALAQKVAPRKETSEALKKDAKQDAATSSAKRGPGRPRKDGHPPNARGGGAQHDNGDEDMDERQPTRRPAARAQTSRRKHEAPKKVESRQCIEPDCVKPARDNSKYCSDECGLKLAKLRLLMMLPGKVEQYYKEQPQSELQALEELRGIDQKIGQIQVQTETMLGYVRTIQRYVMAMKSTTSVSYDEPGDVDFMVNCTVCGMETNGRQLPKHVERCFVRSEKQTSFGTATPAAFNPDNLFCEAYNKANNTYCKRVRVICAEHYKGELENELQICAYPKAWAEGKSLTFPEMFEHGPDLLKDQGFCCAPRKECAQHHRWVQALVGTIECERMNLLTRLDELLERRKIVSMGCATRGDVISLLNFKPPVVAERAN